MKKRVKWTAFLVLLTMLLGMVLTGCGSKETSAPVDKPTEAATKAAEAEKTDAETDAKADTAAPETEASETAAATEAGAEDDGADAGERIKVTFFAGDYDYIIEDGFLENFIETRLPDVDIEWERDADKEALSLRILSDDCPDLWWGVQANDFQRFYDEGLIRSIPDEMLEEVFPGYITYIRKAVPHMEDPFTYVRRDGDIYGMPALWTIGPYSQAIGVRQDWMENLGIDKYPETLDEFEELMRAFTEDDPDGDGVNNTYGFTCDINPDATIFVPLSFVFGAYGTHPGIFTLKDDKITLGITEPGTRDALEVLKRWYEKGYLDPEFMTNKGDNVDEKILSSRAGSTVCDWFNFYPPEAFWSGKYLLGLEKDGGKWHTIVAPKGPNGDQGLTQRAPMAHIVVAGAHVTDEVLTKYLEVMQLTTFDPEGLLAYNKGEEGVTFERREDGGYDWIPPYDDETERIKFGLGKNKDTYNAGGFFNDYDLQFEYMTAPEYIDLRREAESRNIGAIDLLDQVVLEKYNEHKVNLNDIATTAFIEFVTGKRDLSEFDAFAEEWLEAGGAEVLEEAQEVYDLYN